MTLQFVGLRCLLTIVGLLFLSGSTSTVPAQTTHPPFPDQAKVRADLERILSAPEFSPSAMQENPLSRALRWTREQWEKFRKWFGDLWDRLFRIPGGMGVTRSAQWVFMALFLTLGGYLIVLLLRNLLARRGTTAPDPTAYTLEEDIDQILDPEQLLQQAQTLARDRDYRRAARALYLAALYRLHQVNILEYSRFRTNGDYLRALQGRNQTELAGAVGPLFREYERYWFGAAAASEADYNRLRENYRQIRTLSETLAAGSPKSEPAEIAPGGGSGPQAEGG